MTIHRYIRLLLAPVAGLLLISSTAGAQMYSRASSEEAHRVQQAAEVLQALTGAPDGDIPGGILKRAEAVVVIPSLVKGGFIVGGEHGNGIISVRDLHKHTWSAPAFVRISGGSFGAQIGMQATDLVLVVMNRNAVDDLLRNEFTLGGSVSVAAGPVGRTSEAEASTDLFMSAQILAYSRSRGLFAGVTLEGAKLSADDQANARFYGEGLSTEQIVRDQPMRIHRIPAVATQWQSTLRTITGIRAAD